MFLVGKSQITLFCLVFQVAHSGSVPFSRISFGQYLLCSYVDMRFVCRLAETVKIKILLALHVSLRRLRLENSMPRPLGYLWRRHWQSAIRVRPQKLLDLHLSLIALK